MTSILYPPLDESPAPKKDDERDSTFHPIKKNVAVYGGAFNPPHLAHLFTIQTLLTFQEIDEVWLLPSNRHAFGKQMVSFKHRTNLLKLCIKSLKDTRICTYEGHYPCSGKTYDTLTDLSQLYPDIHFTLVIGADNLTESHRWHRFDELTQNWNLIVLGRPGHEDILESFSKFDWCTPGPTLPAVSSSEIRYALSSPQDPESQEWTRWIPQVALHYILTHQLYSEPLTSKEVLSSEVPPSIPSTETTTPSIWIWGSGRVGMTYSRCLSNQHFSVNLHSMTPYIQGQPLSKEQWDSALQASIWIFAIRDQDLETVIARFAQDLSRNIQSALITPPSHSLLIVHSSGSHSKQILDPFLTCLSPPPYLSQLHPLQALRGDQYDSLEGVAFLNDLDLTQSPQASQNLTLLIQALGGQSLRFPSPPSSYDQSIYHIGAICASNLSLLCLDLGVSLFHSLGWTKTEALDALIPLIKGNFERLWTHSPPPSPLDILTGPFVRKDASLLEYHLDLLNQRFPNTLLPSFYKHWIDFAWHRLYQTPFPSSSKTREADSTLSKSQSNQLKNEE